MCADDLAVVKQLLLDNDYPSKFIDYCINKRINNLEYRAEDDKNNENVGYDIQKRIIAKKPKIRIPNIDGFYNSMSGMFNKYDVITILIIEKSNSNLVIKAKDELKKGENTNNVDRKSVV